MAGKYGSFLWFSDLHFDPLYGRVGASDWRGQGCSEESAPSGGKIGCDSPLSLIEGAVRAAKDVSPEFVLVTGDLSRHDMTYFDDPDAILQEIFNSIANLFTSSFSASSIIFCLGNNDGREDYYLDVADPQVLNMAANSDLKSTFVGDELQTFKSGGYFSRSVSDTVTMLSITTVMYSMNHHPISSSEDPLGQFAWIAKELAKARENGSYVMVAGHVPPTIGSYRKAQFWQDRYLDQYIALVDEYSDVVSAQLFGHLHSDEFRVLPFVSKDAPPLLLTSSVTPVFGGNPSFRVVTYDENIGDVTDYTTYFLNLNEDVNASWQSLYTFKTAYSVNDLTTQSMQSIVDSIAISGEALNTYTSYQRVNAPQPPCDRQCAAEWACVLTSATRREYDACAPAAWWQLGSSSQQQLILAAITGGIVAFVSAFGFLFMCYRRRRRKRNYEDIAEFNIDADVANQDGLSLT